MLADVTQHISADQVAERVNERHPDVHLSTVYRTLEFLEDLGVITRVDSGKAVATYHLSGHGHHHAMCDVCGVLIEFDNKELDGLINYLDRTYGFAAAPKHLIVGGRCTTCRTLNSDNLAE